MLITPRGWSLRWQWAGLMLCEGDFLDRSCMGSRGSRDAGTICVAIADRGILLVMKSSTL